MLQTDIYETRASIAPEFNQLTYAASLGHTGIVHSLLINFGWDVHGLDARGVDALYTACARNQKHVVVQLLRWGADPSRLLSNAQWTPLMAAAYLGHTDIVKLLVQYCPPSVLAIESPTNGETAVFCAAMGGHAECVMILLQHGATPHLMNHGFNVLDYAAKCGHAQVVDILAQYIRQADDMSLLSRAMYVATNYNHVGVVQILMEYGADPLYAMKDGTTPLFQAVLKDHMDVLAVFAAGNN